MARPLRIEFPGAIYRVTSPWSYRLNIVLSDRDWAIIQAYNESGYIR